MFNPTASLQKQDIQPIVYQLDAINDNLIQIIQLLQQMNNDKGVENESNQD